MKNKLKIIFTCLFIALLAFNSYAEDKSIKMSTTTSTRDSGLLDVLLPEFQKDTGIEIKVIAKGTGAAIRDGMDGNVDVIFVHAKDREEQFVADGYGTKRYQVMHNDFIVLGPDKDPAGISGISDAATAFKRIAESKSTFVSRGDDSGTHTKEQEIWDKTGLPMKKESQEILKDGKTSTITFTCPENPGEWYLSIGQGMGATLTLANEKHAYTLADRGTFIEYKLSKIPGIDLNILCQGDAALQNPYGIIPVNPEKFPHVKFDLVKQFVDWIISEKGQAMIANYKIHGQQLFYPDAVNID